MEFRAIVVDIKVGIPVITCQRRIDNSYVIALITEEDGHELQSFVVLIWKQGIWSLVDPLRSIFITSEKCRRCEYRVGSIWDRIRIISEAVELRLKWLFLVKDIRYQVTDSTVQHKHYNVLSCLAQRNGRNLWSVSACLIIWIELNDLRRVVGTYSYDRKDTYQKNGQRDLPELGYDEIQCCAYSYYHQCIDEVILKSKCGSVLILQSGRERAELGSEQHVVDYGSAAHHPDRLGKEGAHSRAHEEIENASPEHKAAEWEQHWINDI